MLGDDPPASVVLVHGPAGVGKSALLRELARRAAVRGAHPIAIEARDLAPLADALSEAVEPVMAVERPLLLLDSWERLSALDGYLRSELLPRLPFDAVVVLASRRAPARGWFTDGWENIVLDLPLAPLDSGESDALLAARGISDPDLRAEAIAWAGGSPLALVLAADAGVPAAAPPTEAPPAVVEALLQRLLDAQPEGEERSVLAVAALARVTTPELLAEVVPGIDARRSFAWLSSHPSAEPLRTGVTLHDLVGRALRADLRRRMPEFERDLRRRLADALFSRSTRDGLLQLTLDLQHLVQDPAIRWGFSWDPSGRYRIDAPRPSDVDALSAVGGHAARMWIDSARPYFESAPERVTIIRDQDDAIAGYGIGVTPGNAPAFVDSDPVLGPRVRHAAAHVHRGAAVVWRQAIDLTHAPASPVTALIGVAGIIGSGLDNPTAAYLPIVRGNAAAEAFSAACGARPVDELAVDHGGVRVECHVLDYGPGGLLAFQRAAVYRELGLSAPAPPPTFDAVREALRHYASPALLRSTGLTKARIEDAVTEAFGSSAEDKLLRSVLTRGYLDPAPTHELAADELNMSRSAYFRRLKMAVERVASQLGARD